jgi:hypothetical protein
MKKFKLVLKGILLWFTAIVVLLSVCGIDSISDKGFIWLFGTIAIDAILILACIITMTKEEFDIICNNWINSALGIEWNED